MMQGQLSEMKAARDQTNALNAAIVLPVGDPQVFVLADPKTGEVQEWEISPKWENAGNTVTRALDIKLACEPAPPHISDPFPWQSTIAAHPEINLYNGTMFLGPHQSANLSTCRLTPDYIATKVQSNPAEHFYIAGIATYKDAFGDKTHTTRFCREVTRITSDPTKANPGIRLEGMSFCAGNNNCTDDDCQKKP